MPRRLAAAGLALSLGCGDTSFFLSVPDPDASAALVTSRTSPDEDPGFFAIDLASGPAVTVPAIGKTWMLTYTQTLSQLGLEPGELGGRVTGHDCALKTPHGSYTTRVTEKSANDWQEAPAPASLLERLTVEGQRCTPCVDWERTASFLLGTEEVESTIFDIAWLEAQRVVASQLSGLILIDPNGYAPLTGCPDGIDRLSRAGPNRLWATARDPDRVLSIAVDPAALTCEVLSSTVAPRPPLEDSGLAPLGWPSNTSDGVLVANRVGDVDFFDGRAWTEVGTLGSIQPGRDETNPLIEATADNRVIGSMHWENISYWNGTGRFEKKQVGAITGIDAVAHLPSLGTVVGLGPPGIDVLTEQGNNFVSLGFERGFDSIKRIAAFRGGFLMLYDFGSFVQYHPEADFCRTNDEVLMATGVASNMLVSEDLVFVAGRPKQLPGGGPTTGFWFTPK